jgi:putative endonuclease
MDLHQFYVYIITNATKTVLYIGVTNDLPQRLLEHFLGQKSPKAFTGRYKCHYLLYYENFQWIEDAIAREKELKGWSRSKKEALIATKNPQWLFLNETIMKWPPGADAVKRG